MHHSIAVALPNSSTRRYDVTEGTVIPSTGHANIPANDFASIVESIETQIFQHLSYRHL
jgi:hypothetical protein